jgi:hypothetical protein
MPLAVALNNQGTNSNLRTQPLTRKQNQSWFRAETVTPEWLFPQEKVTLYIFPSSKKTLILLNAAPTTLTRPHPKGRRPDIYQPGPKAQVSAP